MTNDLITQAANVGFPIVVAIYLLVRMEGKMDKLTSSIVSLSNVIQNNLKMCEGDK